MKRAIHFGHIDYLAAHLDADERIARGEQQRQCPTCKLWFWPDHAAQHQHEVPNE